MKSHPFLFLLNIPRALSEHNKKILMSLLILKISLYIQEINEQ